MSRSVHLATEDRRNGVAIYSNESANRWPSLDGMKAQLIRRYYRSAQHSDRLFVLEATLLGGVLRFYHLGWKSLWYDEAVLYWISQGTLSDVLEANTHINCALTAPVLSLLSLINDHYELVGRMSSTGWPIYRVQD